MKPAVILSLLSLAFAPALTAAPTPKPGPKPAAATPKPAPEKPADKPVVPAQPKVAELPDPVAVVEGVEIKKAELEAALQQVLTAQGVPPEQLAQIPPDQKSEFYSILLEDMISNKLIEARSKDTKVADEEVAAALARAEKNFGGPEELKKQIEASGQTVEKVKENLRAQIRQQHWKEEQTKGKDTVSDADLEKFYKENLDKFKQPESVQVSHILIEIGPDAKPAEVVAKEKAAQAVLARLKKGDDFAAVAKEMSEDKATKDKGGELGTLSREDNIPKEFSDAVFALKKGEMSTEPVRTDMGYHIIKVMDRKEPETVPLEKAKPQLLAFLQRSKREEAMTEVMRDIRSKADVKVNLPKPAPAPAPAPGPAPAAAPELPTK